MAGEAINPGRSVPLGVIGSILLAAVVYILLQIAFIGALAPTDLVNGWHGINFSSPFAQLAMALGLNWLVFLLYADAFVSPSGTGATYMATTTRMIYGMERNGTMPKIFGHVHPLYHIPRQAMWFNLAVAYVFLFFFRSWNGLAAVISVATVISYLTGPVCVASLRRTAADLERPLRLQGLAVLAPFAFVFSSLVLYWARWPLTGKIILLIVAALPIYFWYQAKEGWPEFRREVQGALWMMVYLFVMAILSYCGSSQFGGINLLPYGVDMVVVALVSLGFYYWGIQSGWRTRYLDQEHSA
jgi:amino acid transporter